MAIRQEEFTGSDGELGRPTPTAPSSSSCIGGARISPYGQVLERVALRVTDWAGSSWAFGVAVATILVWAIVGPIFHYSDTWQLVINTGTTIVTFLMVFLLQRAQNKDSRAIHVKLNEMLAGLEGASNRLINAEDLTEEEVRRLHDRFQQVAELATSDLRPNASHSIEEAVAETMSEAAAEETAAQPTRTQLPPGH